jgi:hypothetical protein
MVEVVVTNPLPGQPSVVQAKCANDCPPGDVQLIKSDDGSYTALSPNAAIKTSEATARQVSKKDPRKPQKDEEVWPCTVAFLYSRIKPNTENLTDNGAATGSETSWDFVRGYSSSASDSYAYIARQRFDTFGDYFTVQDALENKLKPNRLITPTGSGAGAAKDNAAIASGSADAITIWFYIGVPDDALTNGRIVQITGPPLHPSAGIVTNSGPGFCMEVYRSGSVASAIFPREQIGLGALTKHLKESFSELGGQIGYAGKIERWRGTQDYSTSIPISYFRNTPLPSEPNQSPTSVPAWYIPSSSSNPWNFTNNSWFEFGWPSPQFIGCASSSWINIEIAALNATTSCGAAIANEQWYWGGDASPTRGVIDKNNPGGFIGTEGMFVCWRGHKDHAAMAQSYFEAFKNYWGIAGNVTKLGSANLYGCEIPPELGGGYPPPPPSDASRFSSESHGRKAEVWLKICKQDLEPIEIKLPFEFAAIVERITVIGGGSLNTGADFENGKNASLFSTYGKNGNNFTTLNFDPYCLENPHATLSIDKEFAYINISYGAEDVWEEPLTLPIRPRLGNLGFGSPRTGSGSNYGSDFPIPRRPGKNPSDIGLSSNDIKNSGDTRSTEPDTHPRIVKHCFSSCWCCIVKLPTKENPEPVIIATQKYKRGEEIVLTQNSPDTKFDNKFLIADYRTENYLNNTEINAVQKVEPQSYYATFGGLPALAQIINYTSSNINQLAPAFYKDQQDWTVMDWLYFQFQESPRQYNPLNTVLLPGVRTRSGEISGTIFESDNRFDRHARAERIMPSTAFNSLSVSAPTYRVYNFTAPYPLFVAFKEQLIGNGLIENNNLIKWFRISTSSFPVLGQLRRNPL